MYRSYTNATIFYTVCSSDTRFSKNKPRRVVAVFAYTLRGLDVFFAIFANHIQTPLIFTRFAHRPQGLAKNKPRRVFAICASTLRGLDTCFAILAGPIQTPLIYVRFPHRTQGLAKKYT